MGRNARKRANRELKRQQNKIPPKESLPQIKPSTPQGMQVATGDGIINFIKGKECIGFIQEDFDCCSEKCIIEYSPLFAKDNIACLMIPRQNYTDVLKYLCKYVVLFRLGSKDCPVEDIKKLLAYLQHVKNLGIRIVYYADDLIFWANNQAPLGLIQLCDAVIVSNETLKNVLINQAKVLKPIFIVPTHLELSRFDQVAPDSYMMSSKRFKVLLTSGGRIGTNHAYEICELANADPELSRDVEWIFNCQGVAQIRSLINKFRNLKKTYIDWLSSAQYYALIKAVDLLIHPAKPEDLSYMCPPEMQQSWLDAKSEVKYTLAGAAKIPIISSPTASYVDAITDGETGFISDTAQDFIDKIKLLKNDRNLRLRIGQAARTDVEKRYNIKDRYIQYRDAIIGNITPETSRIIFSKTPQKLLFIPPISGGPRTFYENMDRWLPELSSNKWRVSLTLEGVTAAIAIAFVAADEIIAEKKKRPDLKVIYRLDGLPMTFGGELDPTNLVKMQEMFRYSDTIVWQSKHCLKMWKDRNLVPPEINAEGPIIHNGVDLSIFAPEGNKYPLPNPKAHNFLNMNWSTFPHKRLDLLQEFIKSHEHNPDILFYLIGNYISTSQIANVNFWKGFSNVIYLGQMRNQSAEAKQMLASIYRAVTGLIFTSEMEGSPNTVLEALGCGCPVIYNPNADIVPEILGEACLPLGLFDRIFDPTTRNNIQVEMKHIAEEYSMENCIRKYLTILEGEL